MMVLLSLALGAKPAEFAGLWANGRAVASIDQKTLRVIYLSDRQALDEKAELSGNRVKLKSFTLELSEDLKVLRSADGEALSRVADADAEATRSRLRVFNAGWFEVKSGLKQLFATAKLAIAEKAAYPTSIDAAGTITNEPCRAPNPGPIPLAPGPAWKAHCYFAFSVEVIGSGDEARFIAHAVGITEPFVGRRWSICTAGEKASQVLPEDQACQ